MSGGWPDLPPAPVLMPCRVRAVGVGIPPSARCPCSSVRDCSGASGAALVPLSSFQLVRPSPAPPSRPPGPPHPSRTSRSPA